MGGMASGKSTTRRLICELYGDKDGELVEKDGMEYTDFGYVACVGKCLKEEGCDGLDSSFGRIKKDGAIATTRHCIASYPLTILEGSQTSGEWTTVLSEICKKENCEFWVVLLDCRFWVNFQRLLARIESRGGTEADISDQRIQSVISKIRQFRGVFEKAKNVEGVHTLYIDTENSSAAAVVWETIKGVGLC